jgi:hypothetical protein
MNSFYSHNHPIKLVLVAPSLIPGEGSEVQKSLAKLPKGKIKPYCWDRGTTYSMFNHPPKGLQADHHVFNKVCLAGCFETVNE